MTFAWAVKLPGRSAAAAAALRLRAGVEVRVDGEAIWLRGSDEGADRAQGGHERRTAAHAASPTDLLLRKLGGERYVIGADGSWTPHGQRIPVAPQPSTGWIRAADFFKPVMPRSALAGQLDVRATLSMCRGGGEQPANILCTPLTELASYSAAAPLIRLTRLRFAVDAAGWALIWGTPLPALAGSRYVESSGVCVPCGWQWTPRVDAAVLQRLLGLGEGELALCQEDGTCERVSAASFVPLGRAAVRLSLAQLGQSAGGAP